jgi:hypothetical protein
LARPGWNRSSNDPEPTQRLNHQVDYGPLVHSMHRISQQQDCTAARIDAGSQQLDGPTTFEREAGPQRRS